MAKSRVQKTNEEIASRLYNSHLKKFHVATFDEDDWRQEIAITIEKCKRKYDWNDPTAASFYTYCHTAFSNHVKNLNKTHTFRTDSPCIKGCEFYVKACRSCVSDEKRANCPAFKAYEQNLHDCVVISRAADNLVNDRESTGLSRTEVDDDFTADLVIFICANSTYSKNYVEALLAGLIDGDATSEAVPESIKRLVEKYSRERGETWR